MATFYLALRFAIREMRGGLRGFFIFICCIALGVGAIGGIHGLSSSITDELTQQGKQLLAGDLRLSILQRQANEKEMAFLKAQGDVSTSVFTHTMARLADGSDQALVAVKAIDNAYPLYGKLITEPASNYESLFGKQSGHYGIVAAPLLLERLQLKTGDILQINNLNFTITAALKDEPDLLSEGFQLAPRLFMSKEAIEKSGLLLPGSLYSYVYKVKVPETINDTALKEIGKKAESDFPNTSWKARTRLDAAPELGRSIDRFSQYLTLVGLTALTVGGIGIGNAVRAYLSRKRNVIATLKSVGASGSFITLVYYIQIMLISIIGILFGLFIALAIPHLAVMFIKPWLPIIGEAHIQPSSLIIAVLFAVLTTSAFTALPLGQVQNVPVTALLRPFDERDKRFPRPVYFILSFILFMLIGALTIFAAYDRSMAFIFLGAFIFAFTILLLLAKIIQFSAYNLRHCRLPMLRLALGNIYRKGSLTSSVVLALGLGLTLLVTLATIDGNLRRQISSSVPKDAPTFFILDIPQGQGEKFAQSIYKIDPAGTFRIEPLLRARITKLNNIPVNEIKVAENVEWVIRGDRRISYSETLPEGNRIVEGAWWPKDKTRKLVSFSSREANRLKLKVGDTITVNVLGREITTEIYNLRDVDWDSFKMNFTMIFSPAALTGAPHGFLATFKTDLNEAAIMRMISKAYPSVTLIQLKDVLKTAGDLVTQIGFAIRASAFIALLASVLVLAGALASGNSVRIHDAVVMKTLGATRAMLIRSYLYEYAILGTATALFAFFAGSGAGLFICRFNMNLNHTEILPQTGITILVFSLILTIGLGLIGIWRILGQKPASYLKDL